MFEVTKKQGFFMSSEAAPWPENLCSTREKRKTGPRYLSDDDAETAKPWDRNRAATECVSGIFLDAEDVRLERQAQAMQFCSGVLRFAKDRKTGRLKLVSVDSCRARFCPVCQWRKSLKMKARFLEALPKITEANPKARWLLLTLTVKNCDLSELSDTITAMNKAWTRLHRKKELAAVLGWTRAMEITKPKDSTTAHPHFHCLLIVSSSYFGKHYIKQEQWTELWKSCLKVDYTPVVHIQTVKPRGKDQTEQEAVGEAASEALKYALKPSDMTADADWSKAVATISHGRRFLGTGGILKGILADQEEATAEDEAEDIEKLASDVRQETGYSWSAPAKKYRRDPAQDRERSALAMRNAAKGVTDDEPITVETLQEKARKRRRPRKDGS